MQQTSGVSISALNGDELWNCHNHSNVGIHIHENPLLFPAPFFQALRMSCANQMPPFIKCIHFWLKPFIALCIDSFVDFREAKTVWTCECAHFLHYSIKIILKLSMRYSGYWIFELFKMLTNRRFVTSRAYLEMAIFHAIFVLMIHKSAFMRVDQTFDAALCNVTMCLFETIKGQLINWRFLVWNRSRI